jgi:glucosamine--fructose-6-phosphate aminotransferase (isomerizing)
MCGIVGYIGKKQAKDYLLDGLQTLEYRGYDSAGIATLDHNQINARKVIGRVEHLKQEEADDPLVGNLGIGHTRWATHGGVINKNTHPHWDHNKEFFVVHNGIIENYEELRSFLQKKGYTFYSDTDTEVVPNLIAYHYKKTKNVTSAFQATLQTLRGAYALTMITIHDPDQLYAAKLSSPLAIGVAEDELFIGSDALPIVDRTHDVVFLEDGEMAILSKNGYKISDIETKKSVERATEIVEVESGSDALGDFEDYMSKEIHESPATVRSAMLGRLKIEDKLIKLGGLELVAEQLRFIDRIIVLACGTSYYAGMVGEYLLEEIADIPVEVQQASEFRYRKEPLSRSTAVLVVSQSGETADTIAALKKLEGSGILKLGIVNAPGSTLARMTDAGVYCHAGPEKAVASTKAFIAQVTIFTLIALYLSKNYTKFTEIIQALDKVPSQLETILAQEDKIAKIAQKYAHHRDFLYIGRRYAFPVALEGALKIKEISYIHAEGFAGGEMKHGPLALIDKDFPTFAIALTNDLDEKSVSNMQEIHARKGPIIALVDDEESPAAKLADDIIVIPKAIEQTQSTLAAVVTHLFAYYAAKELGRDIDKPRNLAKSVTVE